MLRRLTKFLPSNFTLALLVTVLLATLLPTSGRGAAMFNDATVFAIGLLFFMHGAKLPRETLIAGLKHWRLHLTVLSFTYVLFPLLGWALKPIFLPFVTPDLYIGILFLCVLPSTVQSSIAFTSIARGNVSAAVCGATASNLLGVFITPVLVGLLVVSHDGGGSWDSVLRISCQLLLPFIAGQLARHWIGAWVQRHAKVLSMVDQGSILLVVYTAFSEAIIEGLWTRMSLTTMLSLTLICCVLLGIVLFLTKFVSRKLGFNKADEITIIFCGSKKSLSSGVAMAKVLFASSMVGSIVLPLMLFHQIQLMVCAVLAERFAKRTED